MDVSGSRWCVAVVPGLTLVSPGGNRVTIFIWQKKSVKHCSTHGEIVLLTNIQYIIHIDGGKAKARSGSLPCLKSITHKSIIMCVKMKSSSEYFVNIYCQKHYMLDNPRADFP